MKRLLIFGLVFGPLLLMGQKKEDIVAIQRDLANLEDQVKQLQRAQDEKMAALQSMLQQSVDASGHVNTGLAAVQKELDSKLSDQQTKLVAPLATLGANTMDVSLPTNHHPADGDALTDAELRLLPLLSTHLSFPEIAAEMFLSPNTVKSQAYSLYRKLGASTRTQAVARSRELGLLEG